MHLLLNLSYLLVSDYDDGSAENLEYEENIEEVREDNLEAAKKQHLSKIRKKKVQLMDNEFIHDGVYWSSTDR